MAETTLTTPRRRRRLRRGQDGFSLIEMMIALTVLLIGISGIIAFQVATMHSSSYSRHISEAAVLGEDKMEQLRTVPLVTLVAGTEQINASGLVDATGPFTRDWTISWNGNIATITVGVTWLEQGEEPHRVTYRTQRAM